MLLVCALEPGDIMSKSASSSQDQPDTAQDAAQLSSKPAAVEHKSKMLHLTIELFLFFDILQNKYSVQFLVTQMLCVCYTVGANPLACREIIITITIMI